MINTGDLRKGITIELDGTLYSVMDYQHIKMGRGSAQVRLKLRDVRQGHTIERTFQAGEKFSRARLDRRTMQFLYEDGGLYYFMNTETYDQTPLTKEQVGDALLYLKENDTCDLLTYGEDPIGIELPTTVDTQSGADGPRLQGRHDVRGHQASDARNRTHGSGSVVYRRRQCSEGRYTIRQPCRAGEQLVQMQSLTVGQIAMHLRAVLENDPILTDIWISGEVSNLSRPNSGHLYFTLKDGQAQLRCALFRTKVTALSTIALENGAAVLAHGYVSFYEARGDIQLYVDAVEPEGTGTLRRSSFACGHNWRRKAFLPPPASVHCRAFRNESVSLPRPPGLSFTTSARF